MTIPEQAVELLPCPFCGGAMQPRHALWPSEGDVDGIIHASPTDCPLPEFSVHVADEGVSVAAAWNTRASLMGVKCTEDVARADPLIVPTNPCLKKLCVDEPFFVLLGRDEQAPMAVERWADYRAAAEGKSEWTEQAREVANSMRAYRIARKAGLASTVPASVPHTGQPQEGLTLSDITDVVWEVLAAWRPGMSDEVKHTLGIRIADRLARKTDTAAPASPQREEPHTFSCLKEKCPLGGMKLVVIDVEPAPPVIAEPKPIVADEQTK